MIDARFFEEYPLYREFAVAGGFPESMPHIAFTKALPILNMPCDVCTKNQSFYAHHVSHDSGASTGGGVHSKPASTITTAHYCCVACHKSLVAFTFRISEDRARIVKTGQYPPWSIDPSRAVAKALGSHLGNFKKGLVCESQSYGIGAFAYYRRIVEDVIERLLNDIGELLKNDPSYEDYKHKLANVKDSKAAEARIAVVKDMLPSTLRPGGMNPLGNLHHALSQGLHAEDDDYCLALAEATRESLVYLIEHVEAAQHKAKDYAQNMEAIKKRLEKKGKAKTDPK